MLEFTQRRKSILFISSAKSRAWSSHSQAVLSILHSSPTSLNQPLIAQAKLRVNTPGDKYEQEADRIAEQVMRTPDATVQRQEEEEEPIQTSPSPVTNIITPLLQRQAEPGEEEEIHESAPTRDADELVDHEILESVPTRDAGELGEGEDLSHSPESVPSLGEEKLIHSLESISMGDTDEYGEEEELIQPKNNPTTTPRVTPKIAQDIYAFKGSGQALPASERIFFEPRFGRDFSNVRLHTDYRAARAAQAINARAFTFGNDVVFGAGQYFPGSPSGRSLLAHELTHVIQQHRAQGYVRRQNEHRKNLKILYSLNTPLIQMRNIDGDFNNCKGDSSNRKSWCLIRGKVWCIGFGIRLPYSNLTRLLGGFTCDKAYAWTCQKTYKNDISFCTRKRNCLKKGIPHRKTPNDCESWFDGFSKGGSGDPWPNFIRTKNWYNDWGKKPNNWPPKVKLKHWTHYWNKIREPRGAGIY